MLRMSALSHLHVQWARFAMTHDCLPSHPRYEAATCAAPVHCAPSGIARESMHAFRPSPQLPCLQALGKYNVICMEDLIHEIFTVGPAFKQASNFLWPFQLNTPKGGLSVKRRHFVEGGQYGDREQYINNLVRRMN